jgi:predicted GNAT family acetyltransferase
VKRNRERSRYEIVIDGQVAGVADYRETGTAVVFPHRESAASMRGRGVAGKLIRAALDDVRVMKRTVVPRCWFVAQFIDDHPEYRDLLAA